jgi:hypothetical protein
VSLFPLNFLVQCWQIDFGPVDQTCYEMNVLKMEDIFIDEKFTSYPLPVIHLAWFGLRDCD